MEAFLSEEGWICFIPSCCKYCVTSWLVNSVPKSKKDRFYDVATAAAATREATASIHDVSGEKQRGQQALCRRGEAAASNGDKAVWWCREIGAMRAGAKLRRWERELNQNNKSDSMGSRVEMQTAVMRRRRRRTETQPAAVATVKKPTSGNMW